MRPLLAALALCLLPLAALAQAPPSNPIVARMLAFAEAYNAQDAEAIAGFYTDDAVLLPPGEAPVVGRSAIAAHYARAFAAGARDLEFRIFEVIAYEGRAVELGETAVRLGDQRIIGRYMHYWEALGDEILLVRDMYQVVRVE
jgi:ketosteroid isomerase-like protein